MKKLTSLCALCVLASTTATQEPAPRHLTGAPVKLTTEPATVSGARELKDGRLLISDAKRAMVYIVDQRTGTMQQIGSPGGDSTQYAQPGGFYSGLGDTTYLLDRGQAKFLVITPAGAIVGSRSIRVRGRSGGSSDDVDHQRIDARGLAYFADMNGAFRAMATGHADDSLRLVRFDAARQHGDTVIALRQREQKVQNIDAQRQLSRAVLGSPEDDWGVAADGRVAVVRASPYRVDWLAANGQVSRGPVIATTALTYSAEEKDSISTAAARNMPSAGIEGAAKSAPAGIGTVFASNKAPFEPASVVVSPEGRVWVARNQPPNATGALYDVFDSHGDRVDRVELSRGARIIGFGRAAVYAVERDAGGHIVLRKYNLS